MTESRKSMKRTKIVVQSKFLVSLKEKLKTLLAVSERILLDSSNSKERESRWRISFVCARNKNERKSDSITRQISLNKQFVLREHSFERRETTRKGLQTRLKETRIDHVWLRLPSSDYDGNASSSVVALSPTSTKNDINKILATRN